MACFIVPAAEAVVTTVVTKAVKKKEDKTEVKTGFASKLKYLNTMLWGGSALLAFEHMWHGEVVPFFPFLTNAIDSVSRAEMLHEMASAGTAMAVLVTAVWAAGTAIVSAVEKRTSNEKQEA